MKKMKNYFKISFQVFLSIVVMLLLWVYHTEISILKSEIKSLKMKLENPMTDRDKIENLSFDTIADMVACTKLAIGDKVKIWGYYSKGDSSSHERIIGSSDLGLGVQLSNGLWANLDIKNGEVNVKHCGALGTDWNSDDTAVLQKVFQNAKFMGYNIFLPVGIFNTSQTLPWDSRVDIRGINPSAQDPDEWEHTSVLRLTSQTDIPLLKVAYTEQYGRISGVYLKGRYAIDTAVKNVNQDGIYVEAYPIYPGTEVQLKITECTIANFEGSGIHIGAYRRAIKIDKCNIGYNGRHGVYVGSTDNEIINSPIHNNMLNNVTFDAYMNKMHGCDIFRARENGVALYLSGKYTTISMCNVNANYKNGIYMDDGTKGNTFSDLTFADNGLEKDATYYDINMKQGKATLSNITFFDTGVGRNKVIQNIYTTVTQRAVNVVQDSSTISLGTPLTDRELLLQGNVKISYGTVAPASGTYKKGDLVLNSDSDAYDNIGWVCVTAGTPGTWKMLPRISLADEFDSLNSKKTTRRITNASSLDITSLFAFLGNDEFCEITIRPIATNNTCISKYIISKDTNGDLDVTEIKRDTGINGESLVYWDTDTLYLKNNGPSGDYAYNIVFLYQF